MRLKLKNTPEQIELVKAMGSKDVSVSREASEAFAAFLGPVIQQVINQASTSGAIYQDASYDEDDHPSFPLDLYMINLLVISALGPRVLLAGFLFLRMSQRRKS